MPSPDDQPHDALVPADREAYVVTIFLRPHGDIRPTACDIRVIRQSVVAWRIKASDGRAEPVTCEGSIPGALMWLRPGLGAFELYEPRSARTYVDEGVAKIEALRRAHSEWERAQRHAQQVAERLLA